jgi:crotonobetainyl-CoA:carnitine CoA-transferase CaiB-like acyl-CoA transferase
MGQADDPLDMIDPSDSKAQHPTLGGGPLAGVRVLDLSAYIAGPYGCSLLADLGADVIKVEPPIGDNMRNYPSTLSAECRLFLGVNRGKRSIVIDLKQPEGLALLKQLVAEVDVFVHNFRPGVAERLGIGYEDLAPSHPRLIYAGLSGYGDSGPLSTRAGFDQVLQTMTGICVGQAEPGEPPELVYGSVVDYFAASMLALGLAAALYARQHTGRGQRLGVSLLGAALCSQSGRFIWAEGEDAEVDRSTRSTGVNAIFPTKEGHIYLSATAPHFWSSLCRLIGCEDMALDPEYDSLPKRVLRKAEITDRINAALSRRSAVEWEALLSGEVPCAVAQPIEAMFDHEQVLAQDHVATYQHPRVGAYRGFRTPIQFEGTPLAQPRSAPALGQHTREVLAEAGMQEDSIHLLREASVVR